MSTLFFALTFILQVHAVEFRSEYGVDAAGALSRKIVMSCNDSESSICKKECEMDSCQVAEPTCVNCSGSSSELLQVLFSKVTQFYKRSHQTDQVANTLVNLIKDQKLVILDSQSLFNFYTNISEKESLVEFKKLCPAGTYQAMIAVRLDSYGFPEKPVASICEGIDRRQSIYNLVSIDSNSDFDDQKTILEELPIRLKFEFKLK